VISFGVERILMAGEKQSLARILLGLVAWSAAFVLLLWGFFSLQLINENSLFGALAILIWAGAGIVIGNRLIQTMFDLRNHLFPKFGKSRLSRRSEILFLMFWLLVLIVAVFVRGLGGNDETTARALKGISAALLLSGFVGLFIGFLMLGTSWKVIARGGATVMRVGIGARLFSFLMGAGLLCLSVLVVIALLEGPPESPGIFLGAIFGVILFFVVISFAVAGAWAVFGSLFAKIRYDDAQICATMDRFLNRKHCHRWDDLVRVDEVGGFLRLYFSDGGRVTAAFGMTSYYDLQDFARAVLDRNQLGEGKT
jgi:hypothetical protein